MANLAVLTVTGAEKYAKYAGGLLPFAVITKARLGEGGWESSSLARVARAPDPTFTDLDVVLDTTRGSAAKRYNTGENFGYFEKALVSGDFSFLAPSTLLVSAVLLTSEYNYKNTGVLVYDVGGPYTSPEIYELGLYDADGDMIVYATLDRQLKDATRQIANVVRLPYVAG